MPLGEGIHTGQRLTGKVKGSGLEMRCGSCPYRDADIHEATGSVDQEHLGGSKSAVPFWDPSLGVAGEAKDKSKGPRKDDWKDRAPQLLLALTVIISVTQRRGGMEFMLSPADTQARGKRDTKGAYYPPSPCIRPSSGQYLMAGTNEKTRLPPGSL